MKKFLYLVASLVTCTSLSACGGSSPSTSSGGTSSGGGEDKWWTTTGTIQKDSQGNIVYDDINISLTHVVCGHDQVGYENLIKQFNSEYNNKIHIDYETFNQQTIDDTVSKRISQNQNPPDLVMQHQKSHRNFEVNKLIQPVDECFQYAEIPLSKDTFIPGFAEFCDLSYGDGSRIFDFPVDGQSIVGYYRKDLLNELGLAVPTNRSELIAAAKAAKNKWPNMETPIGITGNQEFYKFYLTTTALSQNGFQFYDETDGYLSHWTTEEAKTAFLNGVHAVQDLDTVEGVYKKVDDETSGLNNFCNNDKYLFFFDLPFDANVIFEQFATHHSCSVSDVKNTYIGGFSVSKMFAMDASKDYAKNIFGDSHAFMVSKTVTDMTKKAAIAEFIHWFASKGEIGAKWAELGHAAGCKAIIQSNEYSTSDFVKDYTEKWYGDMSTFRTPGKTPFYKITFDGSGIYDAFVKAYAASSDNARVTALKNSEKKVNDTIRML